MRDRLAEFVVPEVMVAPAAPAGASVWADDVWEDFAEGLGDEVAMPLFSLILADCSRLTAVGSATAIHGLSRIFMGAAMMILLVSFFCSKVANIA